MREAVHMRNFFRHFAKDESGMGVVEVILIIGFDRFGYHLSDTDHKGSK